MKNDVLQVLVKDERGRMLKLKKDCKTRWSSVMTMIRNFLEIRVQIHKDLKERGLLSMFLTNQEIEHAEDLTAALKIIAFLTAKLGARDMNLAKADRIFEFALRHLDQLDSTVAKDLRELMYERIEERRLKTIATLLAYLENPKFRLAAGREERLPYSNKTEITEAAISVYTRLFHKETPTPEATAQVV